MNKHHSRKIAYITTISLRTVPMTKTERRKSQIPGSRSHPQIPTFPIPITTPSPPAKKRDGKQGAYTVHTGWQKRGSGKRPEGPGSRRASSRLSRLVSSRLLCPSRSRLPRSILAPRRERRGGRGRGEWWMGGWTDGKGRGQGRAGGQSRVEVRAGESERGVGGKSWAGFAWGVGVVVVCVGGCALDGITQVRRTCCVFCWW